MHRKIIITLASILFSYNFIQAFEDKNSRFYEVQDADKNISVFIRDHFNHAYDLKKSFELAGKDYQQYLDESIKKDYPDYFIGRHVGKIGEFYSKDADIGEEITDIHDKANLLIASDLRENRENIEAKLYAILIKVLHSKSLEIVKQDGQYYIHDTKKNKTRFNKVLNYVAHHQQRVLNYVGDVQQIEFNVDYVITKMFGEFNNSLVQYMIDNFIRAKNINEFGRNVVKISFSIQNLDAINIDQVDYRLMIACQNKGLETLAVVQLLIDKGADVNNKYCPLMTACRYNQGPQALAIVRLLVEKGADVNFRNFAGYTPLMYACEYNKGFQAIAIVQFLVYQGADVNACNNCYVTPLVSACQNEGPQVLAIVQFLIEKGADVNLRNDRFHCNPLPFACQNEGPEAFTIVKLLIEQGADINSHLLGDACGRNKSQQALAIVELLVDKGADVNSLDFWKWTPLMYACWSKNPQKLTIVEFLVNHGADRAFFSGELMYRPFILLKYFKTKRLIQEWFINNSDK